MFQEKDIRLIAGTPLFAGVPAADMPGLLDSLKARQRKYDKGDLILMAGDEITSVGIILSGSGQILREDANGVRSILSELLEGDLFGEAYAAAEIPEIPISVICASSCRVLWIPFGNFTKCGQAVTCHDVLMRNMMRLIATKNVWMNEKMRLLSCKTTREKILIYLMDFAQRVQRKKFSIPFSREELADYLAVDRSAMSRELGKLRDEGILRFYKNEFELLKVRHEE